MFAVNGGQRGLADLPNEILVQILSIFSTPDLLPCARLSTRFYDIVLRILQTRIKIQCRLVKNELRIQCYHPSAEVLKVYLDCEYMGNHIFRPHLPDQEQQDFGRLREAYTRFKATAQADDPIARHRRTRAFPNDRGPTTPHFHTVMLDEGELFDQLCTATSLMQSNGREDQIRSAVGISTGVVRIFRSWLAAQDASRFRLGLGESGTLNAITEGDVLWADLKKTVGLRFEVEKIPGVPGPDEHDTRVLDEPPVMYVLHYQEVLVRSTELLLRVEKIQQATMSG